MEGYWARSGGLLAVGPLFNLGRSVSTRSPRKAEDATDDSWHSRNKDTSGIPNDTRDLSNNAIRSCSGFLLEKLQNPEGQIPPHTAIRGTS